MARSKTHTVCVTIHFDRPVTGRQAADAVKADFSGGIVLCTTDDYDVVIGRVGRVKTLQNERKPK